MRRAAQQVSSKRQGGVFVRALPSLTSVSEMFWELFLGNNRRFNLHAAAANHRPAMMKLFGGVGGGERGAFAAPLP